MCVYVYIQFGDLIPLTKCTVLKLTSTINYGILVEMTFERMEKREVENRREDGWEGCLVGRV